MRKNMIFGMIGFVLAVVTCGQAFAELGPNDVSMGVFSIPLPADGKDACRVWLDKQTDSTLTCDDFFASLKGDPGSPGDSACYPVYSYTGWGTLSFQLNIKWCCDSGAVDCQEMTDSYPVEGAYTSYYNAWLAQNCSVVFETTSIENGYQVISKNPCTGEEETYNITGEVGQSANIVSVTPSYTPYPQSTNGGDNPEKQGYMTLTIGYTSGSNSVHTTPDPCEIYVKQYTSGENEGEYYNVKVCHDAQGSSLAGYTPVYAKGGSYEFAYEIPDGTLGLADLANKIPLTTENKYKGPDISNRKIGYKYVLETYPDGTTVETNKEFDQPEEVIEYIENNGEITTKTGKRYTCGGKDTDTVCTNSGVKYCFELSAPTGSVCDNAISVGVALDNEFNGTTGDYLYHGPNVPARTKGYLYKVLTHGSGRVEEVDRKEDECEPVVGTTSAADSTLKTGQRCKCGGMTNVAPCNVANGTYLLGVYGGAQDLLSVMQNQVQVKIKMFGTTLYYCSGSATCCDANQTPGEGDFATCWTSVNIAGLHGDNGASCLATKSGTDWYICCSPSYTGDDCDKVIDDDIIAMLNGMMCQVSYTHKYLHDDGNGGFTENTIKDGARGERVIVTNSCNTATENLDTYYGEDATIEEDDGWPKIIYFAPQKSNGKLVKPGYTRVEHKYLRDGGATTMDSAQTVDSPCITVSKQTRTASGDTVTTQKQTVQKCQIQSYEALSSDSTGTWTTGNWYCLNTDASGNCNGYSENTSDVITSTLKYHLPIMKGNSGNDAVTPIAPGWTYTEEKDAESVTVRNTDRNRDECKTLLTRTNSGSSTVSSSVTRCTVGAPAGTPGLESPYTAGAPYCLGYANGACPNDLIDIGSAIDDAAENDPCAGISGTDNLAKAVKKVVSRAYARSTNSQGALTSVYKMCDDTDHTESTADECKEVPTPSGQTCTNGVWMQCTRQADEGIASATARGTTYGYCATYLQCSGTNSSSSSIVKKTQRSYTVPTKANSGDTYYTTPGKVTDVKIACNGSTISTAESAEDQCEEIPDTSPICPANKVLKTCKRKGDENSTDKKAETTYNLCTNGTSIFGAISDNDPCGGDTTSEAAKKKVKSIQYEYVTRDESGNTAKVGYSKKTTTMCNTAGNTTEYIYDTCVAVAAASGCNGASDKNYKCYNQTQPATASANVREYNTCNPSESAVALSSAVANKLDSDVEFKIKPNSQDSDKEYITITGTNITDKPVVALESLQGQSALELWKEQQTDDTTCQKLFSKDCNALGLTEFMQDISDYGTWAREELQDNPNASANDLSRSSYRATLQPCQGGITLTQNGTDDNGGNKYIMTCTE